MNDIQRIDRALDTYVARRRARGTALPGGFQAKTLAAIMRLPRQHVSMMLQGYRYAQGRHTTKYVIAGSGYGRAARWSILAQPGSDPVAARTARKIAALWAGNDMLKRIKSDLRNEVNPSTVRHATVADQQIDATMQALVGSIEASVKLVETVLATVTP